jgi:GT2 family glycosyltransferase
VSKPRVSIVVVNWKTPKLTAEALRSILQDPQSGSFEIWVVDNNSGDGSVEMFQRDFPEVNTIANADNVGFGRACNQVIPMCTGEHVLLVNPDTFASKGAVSTLLDYMDKHPECGAVGPRVNNPDGSLQLSCRRSFPDLGASFFRLTYLSLIFPKHPLVAKYNLTYADPKDVLEVDALSGAFMMVRKNAIDQVGLLDEDIFMFGEDIDWCWRVKQAGWTVIYEPAAVVYHYHGASSRFRRIGATINLHKGMEVFYRKHLARKYWAPINWAVYLAIWCRAGVFIILSALQQILPAKSVEAVVDTNSVDFTSPQSSSELVSQKANEPALRK